MKYQFILGLLLSSVLLMTAGAAQAQLPQDVNEVGLPDTSIEESLTKILNIGLGFVATIAVLALIYGGIKYITSLGDEKAAEEAKRVILYAIIGLIVIALAAVIVNLVLGALGVGGAGGGGNKAPDIRAPINQ